VQRIKEPPDRLPIGVGLAALGPYSDTRSGFAVHVVVLLHGCRNPVDVSIVAEGTLEMWRSNRRIRFPRRQAVSIGVADASIRDVRIGVAPDSTGRPASAFTSPVPPDPVFGFTPYPPVVLGDFERGVQGVAAMGTFIRWDKTWWPVAMTFTADWVAPRSFGTCYLRLPALTGELAKDGNVSAANAIDTRLRRPAGVHWVVTSYGSSVIVGDAHVLPIESAPPPKLVPTPTWTCDESDLSVQEASAVLSPRGDAHASSLEAFRHGSVLEGGCNAVAVVEQPGSAALRDLLILVIGGGIALGMSLVAELLLRRRPRTVAANR
jgi:hypothetical protein